MNTFTKKAAFPFVDAQETHRLHPDTFGAPTATALAALEVGDAVELCPAYERVWVVIDEIDEDEAAGHVEDRPLMCSAKHGLHPGERVHFQRRHVHLIRKRA